MSSSIQPLEVPEEAVEQAVPTLEGIVEEILADGVEGRNAIGDAERILQTAAPAIRKQERERVKETLGSQYIEDVAARAIGGEVDSYDENRIARRVLDAAALAALEAD